MVAVIALSYTQLSMSWKAVAIQVAAGGLVYTAVILLLRDSFALEMLEIIRRNLPFGKKRSGK